MIEHHPPTAPDPAAPARVLLLGATGTIGQATLSALLAAGHDVVCLGRRAVATPPSGARGVHHQVGDLSDDALWHRTMATHRLSAVISCLASRNGVPTDAWAVDHDLHQRALRAAQASGVKHLVLLSALCVQKPRLAFQQAKLAFEQALMASGMRYSIVRPTAFFKSLSGQVARVQRGKPFVVFGDGQLTACKPIGDADLGHYLAQCLHEPLCWNRILPIGGPGPAITPLDQARMLEQLLGRRVPIQRVPVWVMDGVVKTLSASSRLIPSLATAAELARIGRYYASESMLVWDAAAQRYDAQATPSTGQRRLVDHYADLLAGRVSHHSGEHGVF